MSVPSGKPNDTMCCMNKVCATVQTEKKVEELTSHRVHSYTQCKIKRTHSVSLFILLQGDVLY